MISPDERTLKEAKRDALSVYAAKRQNVRIGFGRKPAIVVIDMADAFTHPEHDLGSDQSDVVESIAEVLRVARSKRIPIFYTVVVYDPDLSDAAGIHIKKSPGASSLISGSEFVNIDKRLEPARGETIIVKKHASAFFGTHLISHLVRRGVDTLIITGLSTSGCVRATANDASAYGFIPVVPRECVGDRAWGPHEWNLFDIETKIGDVVSKEDVNNYLSSLDRNL